MSEIFNPDNLFFRIMTKVFYGATLSLLWLVFSIPVVTAGAATAALDDVMMRLVRDEEGYAVRSFLKAFRKHFKKATVVWVIWLTVSVIICGDLIFFMRMRNPLGIAGSIIFVTGIFVLVLLLMTVFHDLVWFENSWKNLIVHSLKIALGYLPYSFALVILAAVMLYGIYVSVPLMFIFFFFGMGIFSYIASYLWRGVFERLENMQKGIK